MGLRKNGIDDYGMHERYNLALESAWYEGPSPGCLNEAGDPQITQAGPNAAEKILITA